MKNRVDITRLLEAVNRGDPEARDRLISSIHRELQRLAGAMMRKEHGGHTLQPTALVNEAYLRLSEGESNWENRAHFFGAAARAMRRVLIDHARKKASLKRGGEVDRVTFEDVCVGEDEKRLDLLALDEALEALEEVDPRLCKVVELRYFTGLTIEEVATALDISVSSVKRDWTYARAWLYERMRNGRVENSP